MINNKFRQQLNKNKMKLKEKINSHCYYLKLLFTLIFSHFKSIFKLSSFLLNLCGTKNKGKKKREVTVRTRV